jgi:type II secretory pathway pseudopilin PulG
MIYWLSFCLLFFSAKPVWADVAIAPVALYLDGWILVWPMLIAVVFIETILLWIIWAKKQAVSLLQVLFQVTQINVLSTLAGGLFLIFGAQEYLRDFFFLPLVIYFLLTVFIEGVFLLKKYSLRIAWKASLVLNISSYLLILVALVFIPGEIESKKSRQRPASIKTNMHSLQTLVETYGVDWGTEYPTDLRVLETEAKTCENPYWKEILNPEKKSALLYPGQKSRPYSVEYIPILDKKSKKIMGYSIYGYDRQGKRLQMNGRDFVLSNS